MNTVKKVKVIAGEIKDRILSYTEFRIEYDSIISKIKEAIPDISVDDIDIEIGLEEKWYGYEPTPEKYSCFRVTYTRPETPEETQKREDSEKATKTAWEKAERNRYEELKKKYG